MPSFAVAADRHKALIQSRVDAFAGPAESEPAAAPVSHAQW